MGLLDRLFGRSRQQHAAPYPGQGHPGQGYSGQGYANQGPGRYARQPDGQPLPDEQAVARYRYLLRTAPTEQIEQAHAEAFAQLTTDQRQQVLAQLAAAVPAGERPRTDDAGTLARVATRAEMRQPGTLERALGGYGPGYGAGHGPAACWAPSAAWSSAPPSPTRWSTAAWATVGCSAAGTRRPTPRATRTAPGTAATAGTSAAGTSAAATSAAATSAAGTSELSAAPAGGSAGAAGASDPAPAAPAGCTGSRGRNPTTPSRRGTPPRRRATACR